eukprot:4426032-Lingulodinium_polyedra.AAC.1
MRTTFAGCPWAASAENQHGSGTAGTPARGAELSPPLAPASPCTRGCAWTGTGVLDLGVGKE